LRHIHRPRTQPDSCDSRAARPCNANHARRTGAHRRPLMSAPKNIVILSQASFSGAKDLLSAMLQSARTRVPQVWLLRPGKATSPHLTFFLKSAQALLLAIAVCFSLGASDAGSRFN